MPARRQPRARTPSAHRRAELITPFQPQAGINLAGEAVGPADDLVRGFAREALAAKAEARPAEALAMSMATTHTDAQRNAKHDMAL